MQENVHSYVTGYSAANALLAPTNYNDTYGPIQERRDLPAQYATNVSCALIISQNMSKPTKKEKKLPQIQIPHLTHHLQDLRHDL